MQPQTHILFLFGLRQYVHCDCLFPMLWSHQFWNNLYYLIKLLLYMTKKSKQKFKYLENEKSIWSEKKSIFKKSVFSELSVAKNCFRPESAPLRELQNYNCKSLLYPRQKYAETQPTFKLLILRINLLFATPN